MTWSTNQVRATYDQEWRWAKGIAAAICVPRSPANLLA
jgi:hypothetical protein